MSKCRRCFFQGIRSGDVKEKHRHSGRRLPSNTHHRVQGAFLRFGRPYQRDAEHSKLSSSHWWHKTQEWCTINHISDNIYRLLSIFGWCYIVIEGRSCLFMVLKATVVSQFFYFVTQSNVLWSADIYHKLQYSLIILHYVSWPYIKLPSSLFLLTWEQPDIWLSMKRHTQFGSFCQNISTNGHLLKAAVFPGD